MISPPPVTMLDIYKFTQAHRVPTAPAGANHSTPGWAQLDCPWCGDHQQWHLGFNLEGGYFSCWKCGKKSLWDVVGRLLRTNDTGTIKREIARFQIQGRHEPRTAVERKRDIAPPPGTGPMVRQHQRYLRARKFNPAQLERDWGLLGTQHLSGPWNWRVVIPVMNKERRVVAYQGRSILTDAEPKYRFTPDKDWLENPKGVLYGEHLAEDAAIVVEGVTGVWRIGPGAVATCGINWHQEQVEKLRHYKRRFILFDPEPQAQRRAVGLANALSIFPGETEVLSGFSEQPGEFNTTTVDMIRESLGMPKWRPE